MKTPSNINQWLKNQSVMPSPKDDFDHIYQQLDKPKTLNKMVYPWSVAAGITLMAVSLTFFYRDMSISSHSYNKSAISLLNQQVSQLEQQLLTNTTINVSNPGSTQLENEVMLEQWLEHLNQRLAANQNTETQQRLLQAKLTVLKNLNQKNQSIQLI